MSRLTVAEVQEAHDGFHMEVMKEGVIVNDAAWELNDGSDLVKP